MSGETTANACAALTHAGPTACWAGTGRAPQHLVMQFCGSSIRDPLAPAFPLPAVISPLPAPQFSLPHPLFRALYLYTPLLGPIGILNPLLPKCLLDATSFLNPPSEPLHQHKTRSRHHPGALPLTASPITCTVSCLLLARNSNAQSKTKPGRCTSPTREPSSCSGRIF